MKTKMILFLSLVISGPAFADQCELVEPYMADAITKLVKVGDQVGQLCEPCGDELSELDGPSFITVDSISVTKTGDVNAEVFINGKRVDLAYTYIVTAKSNWSTVAVNAAYLVGCYANDVTERFIVGE